MTKRLYEIRKRFEVTMTFGVMAEDEDEAYEMAQNVDVRDKVADNGTPLIDPWPRYTEELVECVTESSVEVDDELPTLINHHSSKN